MGRQHFASPSLADGHLCSFPIFGHCEWSCCEHLGTNICFSVFSSNVCCLKSPCYSSIRKLIQTLNQKRHLLPQYCIIVSSVGLDSMSTRLFRAQEASWAPREYYSSWLALGPARKAEAETQRKKRESQDQGELRGRLLLAPPPLPLH